MALHAGPSGGATSVAASSFPLTPTSGTALSSVNSAVLVDDGVGIMALKNGTTAQKFRVYGTTTGPKYAELSNDGTNTVLNSLADVIYFSINNTIIWGITGSALAPVTTNNTYDFGTTGNQIRNGFFGSDVFIAGPLITAGSGTGLTVNNVGSVRRLTYKVTTTFAAFAAAATTGDKALCVLPAKTRVTACYADTTQKYIGGNISAATLRLGISAGGVEVIASHDVFANPITKGLADADMGTSMTRAAQIQGAYTPSFTANTTLTARITTTSNNTNVLTQGSTTWYLETEVLP